ncbi:MAG TPA: sialidase family protein [Polyangiaceae bacterium]|jgi:photosystem II stability/assembly factor-like uncharacterized protein
MMLARRVWLGGAIVCFACGGEAPSAMRPPPLHVTATPPAPVPQRARWVFANADRGIVGKLDLGDAGVLYIGRSGRRALEKNGKTTDAPTLAVGDLAGVMRDAQGQYVFVAADGATFVTKEPLGALDSSHAGPGGKHTVSTTGKSAIVAIRDGKLVRSTDFGATWTPIEYGGANKPYGRAGAVALDSKGNGVLIHFPQRLFVTHDDGATWAPLASLGIGAHRVARDGDDRIFVLGYRGKHARLDGSTLVVTTDAPKPIFAPATLPSEPPTVTVDEPNATHTILTGQRFVELSITGQGKGRAVVVGSAPLGEKIDKRATSGDLVGEDGLSPHVAGFGSDLIYLRADDDADATAPTTTVFRSNDYGATWQKDAQLNGVEPAETDGLDVAAGPRGWAYVAALCAKGESSGSTCGRRQIRPAGAKAFEDLAFVEEFEPLKFAFDEAHDKVYAIGLREGRKYVYASPLDQNKFTRTRLLDVAAFASASVGVDGKGVAHVLSFDGGRDAWALTRGEDATPSYLALPRGTMELAGARGVLLSSNSEAYETADAGETWTRIASNGWPSNLACTEAGCINGDAQRVGWDLPAIHGDVVSAQAEAPLHDLPHAPPAPPPTEIACTVSGAGAPLTSTPGAELVDGVGPDRWAGITSSPSGAISVVVATKTSVRERPLLGAYPTQAHGTPVEWRSGERVLDDGVVVARYRFTPRSVTGTYNPVDVDLAWWSSRTGQIHHHLLEKVKPFRVSRFGFSGTPAIVDGGFVFQGAAGDPAYFVRDDDKVERLALPEAASDREIERVAKRWLVLDGVGGVVDLSASDDAGKTWKSTAWGLDDLGHFSLASSAGRASLMFGTPTTPTLLFDVDPALPADPPAPTVIDEVPSGACDAHAGRRRFSAYLPSGERSLHVQIASGKGADHWTSSFLAQSRVTHDAPGGKTCTSAYTMHGSDVHAGHYDYQTVYVYPDVSGAWTGWRIRRSDTPGKSGWLAEPLTCKAPK